MKKVCKKSIVLALILASTTTAAAINKAQPSKNKPTLKKKKTQTTQLVKKQVNYDNLWLQISHDLSLPHYENLPQVQKQIIWYQTHPEYLQNAAAHSKYYMYYIYQEIKRRHLPTELVLLPVIESAYDPFAYSWVGAAGIWQMMPQTASGFGLQQDWWYDARKAVKPETNAALDYLTYLHSFFNGNWPLAMAAYNAGEGTVQNAINRNAKIDKKTSFWSLDLPQETENYVPKILALAAIVKNPAKYHVTLPYVDNHAFFTEIKLDKQIDLAMAAQLADIPINQLYELNPGYTRWATDPDGPYRLLLPINSVSIFEENWAKEQGIEPLAWQHYIVKKNDTLPSIATRYQTTVDTIQQVNLLDSMALYDGENLLIPSNVLAPPTPTPNPTKSTATKHITASATG